MERNTSNKGKDTINEENETVSLPDDLMMQIIKWVPIKSVVRMCRVSRSWLNMIGSDDFSRRYLSQSMAEPKILFTSASTSQTMEEPKSLFKPSQRRKHTAPRKLISHVYRWFHSVPQNDPREQNQTRLPSVDLVCDSFSFISQMVLGLVCCYNASGDVVICNPGCGGVYRDLPKVNASMKGLTRFFLGFDEKSQRFKILCVVWSDSCMETQVLSLVDGKSSWRKVECNTPHTRVYRGPSFDGKLYYAAYSLTDLDSFLVICFDLSTEEFSVIKAPTEAKGATLVKINNKVAFILDNVPYRPIWILEGDTWSELRYEIPKLSDDSVQYECIGTIANDQFIFTSTSGHAPLHVIYYHASQNRLERQSVYRDSPSINNTPYPSNQPGMRVEAFLDYVDNPKINSTKTIRDIIFFNRPRA